MIRTNDPIADFYAYDSEQERELSRLPECGECGEHIQDETAYYIDGEWICKDCMKTYERTVLPE